jgi:hypothetical protein
MKPRLAGAAADRLVGATAASELPMTENEVMHVLARIARSGKPSDRLGAAELIGKQLGMFRDKEPGGQVTLEDLVPAAGQGRGGRVSQGAPGLDGVQRLNAQHERQP